MGPSMLLCPPSTTAQLLCHGSPSKPNKPRETSSPTPSSIFAIAHRNSGSLMLCPPLCLRSARRCRRNLPWSTLFASTAAEEGVSVVAAGEDTPVDESEVEQIEEDDSTVTTTDSSSAADEPRTQVRRRSNGNKNVTVSNADLVPGATFPGKVAAIQSFGAFVDLGAFTNGLVHISRLSKGFVKKVEDVVQVGQDVNVQVVDVDLKAKRISLMLVEEEKEQTGGESTPSQRTSRRRTKPATTKMKVGEIVTGTVKNMIRSGVFLTLPDGTDGYLPSGEVVFRGTNANLESTFQVGQEVSVRVLRIEKGRVTLTTRQEVNFDKINEDLNKDVADRATNPFEIAFRRNELISSFLAEREKQKETEPENVNGTVADTKMEDPSSDVTDTPEEVIDEVAIEGKSTENVEAVADAAEESVQVTETVVATESIAEEVAVEGKSTENVEAVADAAEESVQITETVLATEAIAEEVAVEGKSTENVEAVADAVEESVQVIETVVATDAIAKEEEKIETSVDSPSEVNEKQEIRA